MSLGGHFGICGMRHESGFHAFCVFCRWWSMVLWPRVLVLDSILWFQEMGGSLVGGLGGVLPRFVAFVLFWQEPSYSVPLLVMAHYLFCVSSRRCLGCQSSVAFFCHVAIFNETRLSRGSWQRTTPCAACAWTWQDPTSDRKSQEAIRRETRYKMTSSYTWFSISEWCILNDFDTPLAWYFRFFWCSQQLLMEMTTHRFLCKVLGKFWLAQGKWCTLRPFHHHWRAANSAWVCWQRCRCEPLCLIRHVKSTRLNAIAPLLTMFFLMCYTCVARKNLANWWMTCFFILFPPLYLWRSDHQRCGHLAWHVSYLRSTCHVPSYTLWAIPTGDQLSAITIGPFRWLRPHCVPNAQSIRMKHNDTKRLKRDEAFYAISLVSSLSLIFFSIFLRCGWCSPWLPSLPWQCLISIRPP